MACRLVPNKGSEDFLSVIQRLPLQWHGVLCGEGPQRAALEAKCRELDLAERVHFLGLQDNVIPIYAALDAYAFLSAYESFGITIAEAMAARVPVFGFAGNGGYRESKYPLITSANAALIECRKAYESDLPAPKRALDDVAHLIGDYGVHPQRYQQMIERAYQQVRACFDAPIQADAITQVYEYMREPKIPI